MSYDSVYGVFHLKTIRINVLTAEIGANFSTKKLEDMWNCILRHFSYKKHTLLHLMSALIFNKEEEITLVIHSNTPIHS